MIRALAAVALAIAAGQALGVAAPSALARDARVGGKPVSDYPALWWQWANTKRWGARPFQDPSGAQCALNQSGPVWFLAGTDGTDTVHRRCRVPTGRHLFLPVIAMLETATPGVARTCEQVKKAAAANNEHAVLVRVTLDGQAIHASSLRIASECFNAHTRSDYLTRNDGWSPAATDGYWLMLAPLEPGEHSLVVSAHYANPGSPYGDLEQDFRYTLEISDVPPDGGDAADEDQDEGEEDDGEPSPWQGTQV